jgi:hypothetical protein
MNLGLDRLPSMAIDETSWVDTVASAAGLAAELPPSARRHAEAVSHNSPAVGVQRLRWSGSAAAALITFLTSATLVAE